LLHLKVYDGVMGRTNIDIDDALIGRAMRTYRIKTKREAVDLALRKLVGEPMTGAEARAMRGTGWHGDLEEMRAADPVDER
jgi:Arc/MetJ family transcription regulator